MLGGWRSPSATTLRGGRQHSDIDDAGDARMEHDQEDGSEATRDACDKAEVNPEQPACKGRVVLWVRWRLISDDLLSRSRPESSGSSD